MPPTPRFPDDLTIREALSEFFRLNKLPPDGGLGSKWVRVEFKPIPLYFPNTESRKRAVVLHDIHHVTVPFDTTLTGEAEIAAWEIGGSCRGYLAAWALNMGALTYGVFIAPRKVFGAFVRGRHSRNLYNDAYQPEMLNETVGDMRRRFLLDAPLRAATAADRLAFAKWVLLSWLLWDVPIIVLVSLVLWMLLR